MTYPQAPGPVDRTIQATLASVEQRQGGWYRFAFQEDGQQYPLRADTKKVDLIQQAMSLMGQAVSAQIREQESTTINPNSGKPYINRHLNAISPAGYATGVQPVPGAPTPQQWQQAQQQPVYQPQPPQQPQTWQQPPQPQQPVPAQPQQPPTQPPIMGYDRDINIMRQTASKVVARMIEALPPEQQTMQGLIGACEAWMTYYVYGPLRFGVTAFDPMRSADPTASINTDPQRQQWALDGATDTSRPDADAVYARTGVCPDCGRDGGLHMVGCPRGDFASV